MTAEQLRNSLLQEAISGRLVPQDPNDEPAIDLLNKLRQRKEELDRLKQIPHKKPIVPLSLDSEFPFEIPQNWAWCLLAEVSLIQEGAGILKNQYRKEGVQLLTVTNIKEGAIDMGNHIICVEREEYLNKYQQLKLKKGDIVTACSGGSWGKSAIFEESGVYMLNTSTLRLRFWDDLADNKYLYYLTKSFFFRSQLKEQLVGLQPNFGYAHYSKIKVPLPPLAEQKRIVAKLEELLPIVEQYGKAQAELDELNAALPARLRQSVLQQAIQGKLVPQDTNEGTAQELLKQIEAEKQQLIKEGKLKKGKPSAPITEDEIPFEIPSSWEWVRYGDYMDIIGGYAFPSESIKGNEGPRVIRISDISEKGFVDKSVVRYNGKPISEAYKIALNDILIAMTGGTVGKSLWVSYLPEEMYLNQRVAMIRNIWFDTKYVDTVIKAPHIKEIINERKNSTNDNISMVDIKNFMLPLPPLAEQKRIVAKIEELFAEIDKLK